MSILKAAYNGGTFRVAVGVDAQGIKHSMSTDVAPETPDVMGVAGTVFKGGNVKLTGGVKLTGFKASADERTAGQINALFSALGIPPIVRPTSAPVDSTETERVPA